MLLFVVPVWVGFAAICCGFSPRGQDGRMDGWVDGHPSFVVKPLAPRWVVILRFVAVFSRPRGTVSTRIVGATAESAVQINSLYTVDRFYCIVPGTTAVRTLLNVVFRTAVTLTVVALCCSTR